MEQKLYPLIPSQETMCYMLKYSLHKQVTNVAVSFATAKKLDFGVLEQALNLEIERNDCLRLRFIKKKGKLMQYFLPRNYPLVREALRLCHREDLIGFGHEALVPPERDGDRKGFAKKESLQKAADEGMCVLRSPLSGYEICGRLHGAGIPDKD